MQVKRFAPVIATRLAWTVCSLIACGTSLAQTSSLSIVSPQVGATYRPGDTVFVTVSASAPSGLNVVSLAVEGFIQEPAPAFVPPYTFTLKVPQYFPTVGVIRITAVGVTKSGDPLFSPPVGINVEPAADAVADLVSSVSSVRLAYLGQTRRLHYSVVYRGGGGATASASPSLLAFRSSNEAVARVLADGSIVGISPGTAFVEATYLGRVRQISVTVKSTVPGDLDGNGSIDSSDLVILQSAVTARQLPTIAGDARDLNRDGRIDSLDLRTLVTLCTRARCATN